MGEKLALKMQGRALAMQLLYKEATIIKSTLIRKFHCTVKQRSVSYSNRFSVVDKTKTICLFTNITTLYLVQYNLNKEFSKGKKLDLYLSNAC